MHDTPRRAAQSGGVADLVLRRGWDRARQRVTRLLWLGLLAGVTTTVLTAAAMIHTVERASLAEAEASLHTSLSAATRAVDRQLLELDHLLADLAPALRDVVESGAAMPGLTAAATAAEPALAAASDSAAGLASPANEAAMPSAFEAGASAAAVASGSASAPASPLTELLRARLDRQPGLADLVVLDSSGRLLGAARPERVERADQLDRADPGLVAAALGRPVPALAVAMHRPTRAEPLLQLARPLQVGSQRLVVVA
ncbi:MAG: hypothetical protein RLZZ524_1767, partial [Pseudomonadota bacterium]